MSGMKSRVKSLLDDSLPFTSQDTLVKESGASSTKKFREALRDGSPDDSSWETELCKCSSSSQLVYITRSSP